MFSGKASLGTDPEESPAPHNKSSSESVPSVVGRLNFTLKFFFIFLKGLIFNFSGEQPDSKIELSSGSLPRKTCVEESLR